MKKHIQYITFALIILCNPIFSSKAQTITHDHPQSSTVCSNQTVSYWIQNEPSRLAKTQWSVSEGTIIESSLTRATVKWKNAESKNGAAPSGSISVSMEYYITNSQNKDELKTTSINKNLNIKSLKSAIAPPIKCSNNATTLPFGESKTLKIEPQTTPGRINYPGLPNENPVSKFEWTLPSGWSSDGKTGTFISNNNSINVTTDKINAGEIKVCGVSDCDPTDKTGYAILKFTRNTSIAFTQQPSSIPFATSQTNTFTVNLINGLTYEWEAPAGWKINNGSNRYSGKNTNSVNIQSSTCYVANAKVRVRISIDGQYSDWVYASSYVQLPKISYNTSPSMLIPIKLSISSPNISSVTWSGDGVVINSGQNTNNAEVIFSKSGSIKIKAVINISGGCSTYTHEETINVSTPRIEISGPANVCSPGATFSIPNTVGSKTWTIPNSLTIKSGQNTNSIYVTPLPTKYGSGNINVQISYNGTTTTLYKNIYVQYPIVTSVTGPTRISSSGSGGNFQANPYYPSDVANYLWTVTPSTGVSQSKWNNTNYITFSRIGTYTVYCQAVSTSCGSAGSPAYINVSVGSTYSVYPTLTSGLVTVSEASVEEKKLSTKGNNSTTTTYYLYSKASGKLMKSHKINKKGETLDFCNIPRGNYILKINTDSNDSETHDIIIQ